MAYVTLDIPPGLYRTGTDYRSKGRWFNANLWRWFSGEQRPVGGWIAKSIGTLSGAPRAMAAWKSNAGKLWGAVGTHTHLFAMTSGGYLYDITPAGFAAGRPDATTGGAYGDGPYGRGAYGRGQNTSDAVTADASMWVLDTWGEDLVGVMAEDGKLYQWTLDPNMPAAPVPNAPAAGAVIVTAERIMMALGAATDPRLVQWSDREDNTSWATADATTYAGAFTLQTTGKVMCGRRVSGGTLILTDIDAWLATFLGQPLVYGFQKVGSQCGIVSRGAVVATDVQAFWMSSNGFWMFNGYSEPISCDVHDYVFSNINTTQLSKVSAVHVSAFGEIWWFYPSAAAPENDSYVVYNYREDHWNIGAMRRLSGIDKGPFTCPMMCDYDAVKQGGHVWDHESGVDHGGIAPFAESGPVELGQGDRTLMVRKIIPDVNSLGAVSVSFTTHLYPNDAPVAAGPFVVSAQTDARFSARSVGVRLTGADGADFRVGDFRFDVVERGKR